MKELSNRETIVLNILYDAKEPIHCTEVINTLKSKYGFDYAQTTVYTFLKNLIKKGYVKSEKKGITFYSPALDKETVLDNFLTSSAKIWFDGNYNNYAKAVKKLKA